MVTCIKYCTAHNVLVLYCMTKEGKLPTESVSKQESKKSVACMCNIRDEEEFP
jgi:hypothetical protein